MRIATWNVNGLRAREQQLMEWVGREQPDVLCLQEIKQQMTQLSLGLDTGPASLVAYDSFFHGSGGYSGVSLHFKKTLGLGAPKFSHPPFDFETRIVEGRVGNLSIVSVYVPNGGKDYPAKLRFFESMVGWAKATLAEGRELLICGDLNIAHRPADVHPTERKESVVGQRAEERRLFDALLDTGLVDVGRARHPEDEAMFSWWPYWRQAREKNIGWRIDYVLASSALAERATRSVIQREFGSSDHAPMIVEFEEVRLP